MQELKEMGVILPPLPEIGLPKFKMPLPSINYAKLMTNAILFMQMETDLTSELIY